MAKIIMLDNMSKLHNDLLHDGRHDSTHSKI